MSWAIIGQLAGCSDYSLSARKEFWTDTYQVEKSTTKSDVLFYVDQSASMLQEVQTLGARILEFTSRLEAYSDDWHLAAVTDDHYCSMSGILDEQTPYFYDIFEQAVAHTGGNHTERGIFTVLEALKRTGEGQCNEGFLRPDSILHIVFLSDEPDHSPGSPWLEWEQQVKAGTVSPRDTPETTDYWKDYLRAIAAYHDPHDIRISGIVGPLGGCVTTTDGELQTAWEGAGYLEAIRYVNGEQLSICSTWEDSIDVLANQAVLVTTFHLSKAPKSDTILVTVDDEPFDAWSYDAAANDVIFDQPATGGAVVVITYDLL